ncbi:MAG: NADH-quinone oxidoreductase subunit NuoB [Opitutae bacterium]|nr:NADH-quinone oxidoreductase subunit NuoB [Opitutae bacterium]
MLGFRKSPWIIHYDASSCNGCDIETLACLTPLYDVERLGVINTGNPKHADIFIVTGAVNEQSAEVVRNIYHQLPEPKVVMSVGICAASGGIFRECYNVAGGVDSVIPVDVYVPGCAARPEAIIDGVVQALQVLETKQRAMKSATDSIDQALYQRAEKRDVPEILALQKIAYQSDTELYGDEGLPPLEQTLQEIQTEFDRMIFLKTVVNGKIVGSIRGYADGATAHINRCVVHPYFQRRGIGRRLLTEIEKIFPPEIRRFETFTGHKSKRNLFIYEKLGYQVFKTEPFLPTVQRVYMQKDRT